MAFQDGGHLSHPGPRRGGCDSLLRLSHTTDELTNMHSPQGLSENPPVSAKEAYSLHPSRTFRCHTLISLHVGVLNWRHFCPRGGHWTASGVILG